MSIAEKIESYYRIAQWGQQPANQSTETVQTENPLVMDVAKEEEQQNEQLSDKARELEERFLRQKLELLTKMSVLADKINILAQATTSPSPPSTTPTTNEEKFDDIQRQENDSANAKNITNNVDQFNQQTQNDLNKQNHEYNIGLQTQNLTPQQTTAKKARRWIKSERADAKINFVDNRKKASVYCDVAATPLQQASGLQAYDELENSRGLWFPQNNRRIASFHMGSVKFPIDIIFVDNGRVNKIVANIKPGQFGSWSSVCTDVIETNGGWVFDNNVRVGDIVVTPRTKFANRTSYDPLRTLTEASSDEDNSSWKDEMFRTFPFLKEAQENSRVKPNSYNRQPGEFDGRNPSDRFEHNTLPDEFSPWGDGDESNVDPFGEAGLPDGTRSNPGLSSKHFQYTRGFDPSLTDPERHKISPVHPGSSGIDAPIRPSAAKIKLSVDPRILISGSLELIANNPLQWNKDVETGKEMALISDDTISSWIDTLGFEPDYEEALRGVMFTDEYKTKLGEALQKAGKIKNFDLTDSDLLLYRGEK